MSQLEHRIPPPFVALAAAIVMWVLARFTFTLVLPDGLRWTISGAVLALGLLLVLPAAAAFRRAKTTINPVHIEQASQLVVSGPFRFTRNPMYLGMALVLVAWMIFLAAPVCVLVIAFFAAYITRFQITPEERVMAEKFGAAYEAYRQKVRRWI